MDAEEKSVQHPPHFRLDTLQVLDACYQVQSREHHIDQQESRRHHRKKTRPRGVDEFQVEIDVAQVGSPAMYVERAVPIDGAAQCAAVLSSQARIEVFWFHNKNELRIA